MRRIKVKLAFTDETILKRKLELLRTAKVLANGQSFTIIEEEHFEKISYIVILVNDEVSTDNLIQTNWYEKN